ncbi:hypothetical protein ARAM_000956 [Aspergillus rambellii]|uniref:Sister chromatid cohesion protein n=1 Tax=Aspergillus rambellii TaxID=308745 RepID=A0A0F8XRR2_9EURO|nr:hypothetical protein ARAM_000956 [Aspergillus rambellii]
MPSVPLHPRASASPVGASPLHNPLPQLLRTPSGLALLELQGTINVPSQEIPAIEDEFAVASENTHGPNATTYETPVGKLIFPDYSPQTPDDTKWMKRAYLYVGRYQRMTGEVKSSKASCYHSEATETTGIESRRRARNRRDRQI